MRRSRLLIRHSLQHFLNFMRYLSHSLPKRIAGAMLLLFMVLIVPSTIVHAATAVDKTNSGSGTAVDKTGNSGGTLVNPLNGINSLPELLTAILKAVVELGSLLLVFMLVYVGFLFVVAQGNEEKIRSAREALVWTVVGGLILLGAEAISLVIQSTAASLL